MLICIPKYWFTLFCRETIFVANSLTFLAYLFSGLKNMVVYQKWQLSGMHLSQCLCICRNESIAPPQLFRLPLPCPAWQWASQGRQVLISRYRMVQFDVVYLRYSEVVIVKMWMMIMTKVVTLLVMRMMCRLFQQEESVISFLKELNSFQWVAITIIITKPPCH